MEKFSGFPYVKVQFTKTGKIFSAREVMALEELLTGGGVTDLLVLSHGWNNDMADAKGLYRRFVAQFASVAKAAGMRNRQFGVLGVMWPSKRFADEELIPGSGAAAGLEPAAALSAALQDQLDSLKGFFDGRKANRLLEKAKLAAREMEAPGHTQAAEDFVQAMSGLLNTAIISQTGGQDQEEGRVELQVLNPEELLASLQGVSASPQVVEVEVGGAAVLSPAGMAAGAGSAAGFGDFFSNALLGARNLLNFTTFYQMKERAGKVGVLGLHPVLVQVRHKFPQVKLHLIGHSFGARLLTAAVAGPDEQSSLTVDTLILLQGAFSHYSLAEKYDGKRNGFFRRVVTDKKVKGPILISHTRNDRAVGLAYAMASRIANQVAAAIGGPNDIYGGMGCNGALKTPEAVNDFKLERETRYAFQKGKIYNLNGDNCIAHHSDISQPEVARALLAAISKE